MQDRNTDKDLPRRTMLKKGAMVVLATTLAGCAESKKEKPEAGFDSQGMAGFKAACEHSLLQSIVDRRSRRIMKAPQIIRAGSASYQSSEAVQPLTELEEAFLIAMVGKTGWTMPDRPFKDQEGKNILGTPNIKMSGRAAGSADNAQSPATDTTG